MPAARDRGRSKRARPKSGPPTPRVPARANPFAFKPEPALAPQRRRQQAKTRKAAKRIPSDPTRPRFPDVKETPSPPLPPGPWKVPSPAQLDALSPQERLIVKRTMKWAAGYGGLRRAYDAGNLEEKRALLKVGKLLSKSAQANRARSGIPALPLKAAAKKSGAQKIAAATVTPLAARAFSGHGGAIRPIANVARAALIETPRTYVETKGKPIKGDAQFVLDTVSGLVKLPFALAHGQGGEILEAGKESYKRRYGPAAKGDFRKYRKVIEEEGGLSTALDVATVGTPALKAVGFAGKTGALGSKTQRAMTRPRPEMRTSSGVTRRQRSETNKAAPNPVRVYSQRRRDARRAAQVERLDLKRRRSTSRVVDSQAAGGTRRFVRPVKPRVTGAELTRQGKAKQALEAAGARIVRDPKGRIDYIRVPDGPQSAAIKASLRKAGFTAQRTKGDTTTFFPRREVVSREKLAGVPTGRLRERVAQRKDPAKLKGLALNSFRQMGAEARQEFNQATKGLSRPERTALFYSTVGLTSRSPELARHHLQTRRAQILKERGAAKKLTPFQSDEIRTIDYLLEHADEAFTPRLSQAVDRIRPLVAKHEKKNPLLSDPRQRLMARRGPQAEFLGLRMAEGETVPQFVRRVRDQARAAGLPDPAFTPSEQFVTPKFSTYAVGGTKTPRPSRQRTYALQKKGTQRTDPGIIFEGIQRNIKQRHTANLVSDTLERHADKRYRNLNVKQLKDAIAREGWDPGQVMIWLPERYRTQLQIAGQQPTSAATALDDLTAPVTDWREALKASVVTVDDLDRVTAELGPIKGTIIPKSVYNEVFASTKGETMWGRGNERIKTLQSRAVLGAGNINWVAMDTVANTAMTALNANVGPVAWLKAQAFFRRLPDAEKKALEGWMDVGRQRSQTHVPHMGATVNTSWANTWRALRTSPVGHDAKPLTRALSPLLRAQPVRRGIDRFLMLENKVANEPARRAVAYSLLRKDAFQRLDRNLGSLNGQMNRLVGLMAKSPEEQMKAMLREPGMVEEVGRGVDEALGDFGSFTALERQTVGRYMFFYPYARFATRLAFYTLPSNHPIKLSILAKLGQFTEEEQRELIGMTREEAAKGGRGLMAGRFFYEDKDSPTGLKEKSIRSVNPLGNPITEAEGSQHVLQVMTPHLQWVLGQIEKKDIFRNQPWAVQGKTPGFSGDVEMGDLPQNLSIRARILARQFLELPPPTRELLKHHLPGEQGTESLPGPLERPTQYKSAKRKAEAEAKRRRDEKISLPEQILQSQARLFVGKPSDIEKQLARWRKRKALGKPKPKGTGKIDWSAATKGTSGAPQVDWSAASK